MARFSVPAAAYDRYMGRFSEPLAPRFADFAGIGDGMRVLDVGCGPGAMTAELARRAGAAHVAAVDPAEHFAQACAARVPEADVRAAPAERLPYGDGVFDAALAQLVVSFMADAEAGVGEMRRVVRPGGAVAACSWDARRHEMLNVIWSAAEPLVDARHANTEGRLRYRTPEELTVLAEGAGLRDVETSELEVEAPYAGFDDFWAGVETAAGPVGAFVARLDDGERAVLRERCRERLPVAGAFSLSAVAWAVRGRV